jgi:hypothetical protein
MSEPMTVRVEVWPLAADPAGIWLVSGDDAWRDRLPVMADSEPHADVQLLLAQNNVDFHAALVHSTSWRVDGTSVVVTYIAVLRTPGLVLDSWPDAKPVPLELAAAVGRPPVHGPTEVPVPRYVDVLFHGLRHLRFLLDTDATSRQALDGSWRRHLGALTPALARMYEEADAA